MLVTLFYAFYYWHFKDLRTKQAFYVESGLGLSWFRCSWRFSRSQLIMNIETTVVWNPVKFRTENLPNTSLQRTTVIVADLFLVGLASLLLYLFDEPVRRGFFCDDESIRYPVPSSQTVSDEAVALVAVGVPIIVVREEVSKYLHPGYDCFFCQYHHTRIVAKTVKNEGVWWKYFQLISQQFTGQTSWFFVSARILKFWMIWDHESACKCGIIMSFVCCTLQNW